ILLIIWMLRMMNQYLPSCTAISGIDMPFQHTIKKFSVHLKFVKEGGHIHYAATELLKSMCTLIRNSKDSSSHHSYYTNPVLEATRQNAYEFQTISQKCDVNSFVGYHCFRCDLWAYPAYHLDVTYDESVLTILYSNLRD
nr:ankyrin repeat-containing protein ITN1-like [Tanacetum cinerariifolium]